MSFRDLSHSFGRMSRTLLVFFLLERFAFGRAGLFGGGMFSVVGDLTGDNLVHGAKDFGGAIAKSGTEFWTTLNLKPTLSSMKPATTSRK